MKTTMLAMGLCLLLVPSLPRSAAADIQVFPRQGRPTDSQLAPRGPGVIVMGGNYDVDAAFVWMHDTLVGQGAAGGDVVVLRDPDPRAGHDDDYTAYLLGLAAFNSVQTVVLSGTLSAADAAQAVAIVDKAEAVFFGGGDQRDYVGWKGPLLDAVQRVHGRGGIVGGTSAGSALWGGHVNDAIGEHRYGSTLSPAAIADPYDPSITFTHRLFAIPFLERVITDSHFEARDRFGRLATFTARLVADGAASGYALGVGVDEDSALVVDRAGLATLRQYTAGRGGAWIVRGAAATAIARGAPLVDTVTVMRLDSDGQWFDFARECGSGSAYAVTIDGRAASPYAPADPYGARGSPMACAPVPVPADAGSPTPPAPDGGGDGAPGAPVPDADAGQARPGSADAGSPRSGGGDAPVELIPASAPGCACSTARTSSHADDTGALLALGCTLLFTGRRRAATRAVRAHAPHG